MKDTRCNYCKNLYDHETGLGHKRECRMRKKSVVKTKKLPDGRTLRVTFHGQQKGK